jgi:hypothetical protein
LPALQAGASLETCFDFRRRLEPAPSGGGGADTFFISGKMKLRITNAYFHDCRIANSAGRRGEPARTPFTGNSEKRSAGDFKTESPALLNGGY